MDDLRKTASQRYPTDQHSKVPVLFLERGSRKAQKRMSFLKREARSGRKVHRGRTARADISSEPGVMVVAKMEGLNQGASLRSHKQGLCHPKGGRCTCQNDKGGWRLERVTDLALSLKTLKRKPHERSQPETGLRRPYGMKTVKRVAKTLKTQTFRPVAGNS